MTKSSVATAILVAVVISVLLGVGLVAAQPDRNTNSDTIQNSNSGSTTSGQNMNASTLGSSDRKFMMEAGMGSMAEVEWARVALQRASSDAVKQYAQKMIDDHTKASDALKQLASTKGVTLDTALDNKHANTLTKLQGLSGADFDRNYLKEAGVKAHEKMEKLFQREVDRGKDADVKAFASATLPTVQSHLSMARGMLTTGGTGGNTNTSMPDANSNMSGNMNTSGNSNMAGNMNSNTSMNSNTTNSNMADNVNTSGNSNMSGNMNSNTSGNSNMSNSNGNSNMSENSNTSQNTNTTNANGNSNTPRRRR